MTETFADHGLRVARRQRHLMHALAVVVGVAFVASSIAAVITDRAWPWIGAVSTGVVLLYMFVMVFPRGNASVAITEPITPPLKYRDVQPRISALDHAMAAIKKAAAPHAPGRDSGYAELVAERDRLLIDSGVIQGWEASILMDRLREATAAKDAAHAAWVAAARDAKDSWADTVDNIARAAGFDGRDGLYKLLRRHPDAG